MNYFVTNKPITILEEAGRINWTGFGFSVNEVSRAVSQGFQQQDGEQFISILPINDEELLRRRMGAALNETDSEGGYCRIIPQEEAVETRDRLKAVNDALAEVRANTPTDDDIFKAQQLKLLSEINMKLGGIQNV